MEEEVVRIGGRERAGRGLNVGWSRLRRRGRGIRGHQ